MESLGKDHASWDSSLPPSADCEEYAVPDVIITRRLRDRELLRKRKAEAMEKDSAQWVMRAHEGGLKNCSFCRDELGCNHNRETQQSCLRAESPLSYSQVIAPVKSPGRDYKNEQQRRGRRAKRGRGRQMVVKAVLESQPAVDPQPDPQEKAEPVPSEPALPEPGFQQQPPVLAIQNMVGGMQAVAMEGELADRSLDPAGEKDVLKPAEADILEELNTSLENDHQDNEFIPPILY